MKLIDWIKEQSDSRAKKQELIAFLGKSEAAVTAYIYGYRRVPDDISNKISQFTGGEVSAEALKEQYQIFNDRDGSFALSPLKGRRVGKPILSVCINASHDEKVNFLTAVANEIALEGGLL